jgi:hypothetical protein
MSDPSKQIRFYCSHCGYIFAFVLDLFKKEHDYAVNITKPRLPGRCPQCGRFLGPTAEYLDGADDEVVAGS